MAEPNTDKLVRVLAAETMAKAPAVVGPGRGARTDIQPSGDAKRLSSQGTTASYLAARIKRDRSDIAEAVEL